MYVDAIHNRKKDLIHVVERINGERVFNDIPAEYVFYYEHQAGSHRSIFGDSLKKFSTNDGEKFRRELMRMTDPKFGKPKKIFESDINPVFRCLATNYRGVDTPKLNVAFFDIEVGFDPVKGFAPTTDPFNEITAISIYLSWVDRLIALALKPPTYTTEEAQAICDKFPDTFLFEDETELLKTFAALIEDADVLSGWNCLPLTSNVWLDNRITTLEKVVTGDCVLRNGQVMNTHRSGKKRVNRIVLENGMVIEASDEHRIPVMTKKPDQYVRPSTLAETCSDMTVADMKRLVNTDMYLEVALRDNTNPALTFGSLIREHLEDMWSFGNFDMVLPKPLRDRVISDYRSDGTFDQRFPYDRLITSAPDYPRVWMSRCHPTISKSMLVEAAQAEARACVTVAPRQTFDVDLTARIDDDLCHLLGLIFTDGTYNPKTNEIVVYNTDRAMMERVALLARKYTFARGDARYNLVLDRRGKGCYSVKFPRRGLVGLLSPMIFDANAKKKLHVEMLSRLSAEQFRAFFAGLIDGDGCVGQGNMQLCNFQNAVSAVQELMLWNGVYCSATSNNLFVNYTRATEPFLSKLDLWNVDRRTKHEQNTYGPSSNSSAAKLKKFVNKNTAIVRVRSIEETDQFVEMGDIETRDHYFYSHGVRVHNSESFDIPYIVNRITKHVPDSQALLQQLCLWGQTPREREYEKFKRKHKTYDLVGRVHLDYLLLYQKHNPQQLHSYRLDYVGEVEVGENKVPYEGTLDDLYKKDFFRFIEYSRQDTMLLAKIDRKKKFIELANQVAHANCVLFKTTMGSVALVEQAIINEMHEMGFIVPDRKRTLDERAGIDIFADDDADEGEEGRTPVVGAYVARPRIGLHSEIGACDINSLYPSAIRALNMSPETVVGQMRPDETMALIAHRIAEGTPRAESWDGVFHSLEYGHMMARDDVPVTIDFEDGRSITRSGREWYDYIFDPKNHLCITANGTIFRTDKDGMIPMLLAKWYAQRKEMQAKQKEFEIKGAAAHTPEEKAECKAWEEFWNQRQQARKILLNSLYGALLNEGLRFYDERLGQSTTLTGRSIVRHMISKINEVITGDYDLTGKSIIYGDTDSCYFSAYQVLKDDPRYAGYEWTRENIIELYDGIADLVNDSFPEFMHKSFNTTLQRGGIIKAGRELVASRGLFIKKKKYAVLMYDKEGKRLDADGKPGKLKAMGLDLKRADTPKFMQVFLEKILMDVLTDKPLEDMFDDIREFRRAFVDRPGWEKGTPKAVKALMDYVDRDTKATTRAVEMAIMTKGEKTKVSMPGHVRAAMNWNKMCDTMSDRYSMKIGDGSKIIVCKLKPNVYKMDSVAYPIDEPHLPQWFKDLPFDHKLMEETIIDAKLKNLVGVLDWDLDKTKDRMGDDVIVWN